MSIQPDVVAAAAEPDFGLTDEHWEVLIRRITDGKCTPFLGAGACHGTLPLGGTIARDWASEYEYPLCDSYDLAKVAQFVAVHHGDKMFPKDEILAKLGLTMPPSRRKKPDFDDLSEPHSLLARLPIPVYMTTNYDDFLVQALIHHGKVPQRELCRWNSSVRDEPTVFSDERGYQPTHEKPVVFHLHGNEVRSESLVLTEDDYLDFLVNMKDQFLPPVIQKAVTGSSLLFVGYSLSDWSFRVLFRGLVSATERALRRLSVTVQLPLPANNLLDEVHLNNGDRISGKVVNETDQTIELETDIAGPISIDRSFIDESARIRRADDAKIAAGNVRKYLDDYFGDMDIKVFWGTAKDFMRELSTHARDLL